MSMLLADLDATCASLGYFDGVKYEIERNTFQSLKHLIWILRRDGDTHEYRRHLGRTKLLQSDLLPMLAYCDLDEELSDVLLRLLVNLTNPTLLLYREEVPKDGHGRRNFMEHIEIQQGYKEAFASKAVWARLCTRLQKILEIDWASRSEEQGLQIERILVLVRNILQVPANTENERRSDNDASLHDQLLWALQQAGVLELILFIVSSQYENQYHLHALEVIRLVFREQTVDALAHASLRRSALEKQRDEQSLLEAIRREKQQQSARPPTGRHSRFGGTFVIKNMKSISDNNLICHQAFARAKEINFDREKTAQKVSKRFAVQEEEPTQRKSALSIRLFLREFCIEILRSAYNTLVKQVRRTLEHNATAGNDDSFLLWAIQFFMEFNRSIGFQVDLVSESLSVQCFHWVLSRIEHHLDMMSSDKSKAKLWAKRLHIAVNTFKELLLSLRALKSVEDKETSEALFNMLLHNVCYVLEYRECVLHLLINFNETFSTRAFLQDTIDLANIFMKLMEKFCQGRVVVQNKAKKPQKKKKKLQKKSTVDQNQDNVEDKWAIHAFEISEAIQTAAAELEDCPKPYDATSEKDMDEQSEECVVKIHNLMHQNQFTHAVHLLRSAREVWPETGIFGKADTDSENELNILRDIFIANFGIKFPMAVDNNTDEASAGSSDEDDEEREEVAAYTESDFKFEDFVKRLVNTRVVRACTTVLNHWETLEPQALKSIITLLHRISFECKMPAMLYQATLFRVFQRALAAPTSEHNKDLKRLCIYVIRQFTQAAVTNPKIYAELLFSKSVKDANDLEMGYTDNDVGVKGTWSEEQEDELRQLFAENQSNPENEKDVIDWMLDNIIDKTRTRRGIIKKLKELGLIFKAPTKKSNAAKVGKGVWLKEHDDQLRHLYDEFRLSPDCLKQITQSLEPNRSKEATIKRMIEIGIIMDRSEVVKSRKSTKSASRPQNTSDSDSESDLDILPNAASKIDISRKQIAAKPKSKPKKAIVKFNSLQIRSIMKQMSDTNEDNFKSLVEWVQEGISDAAEDIEEVEGDNAVPLVPYNEQQRTALESKEFKNFLTALSFQAPSAEAIKYWRIPGDLTKEDLLARATILTMFLNGDDTYDDDSQPAEDKTSQIAEDVDNGNSSASDEDRPNEIVSPPENRTNYTNKSNSGGSNINEKTTMRLRLIQNFDDSDDSDAEKILEEPGEDAALNNSPIQNKKIGKRIRSDSEPESSDDGVGKVAKKQKKRQILNYEDSD